MDWTTITLAGITAAMLVGQSWANRAPVERCRRKHVDVREEKAHETKE